MGLHASSSGSYSIGGVPLTGKRVSDRIARGITLVPEDRKRDGLVQILSIRENLTLSSLGAVTRGIHLSLKREATRVAEYIKRLTIKVASPENPVSSLSGGNQQKVVIGKALMTGPKVLLMDEPSRGIDIGAKAEVFRTMRKLASEGLGIIFVTSDLEEVLGTGRPHSGDGRWPHHRRIPAMTRAPPTLSPRPRPQRPERRPHDRHDPNPRPSQRQPVVDPALVAGSDLCRPDRGAGLFLGHGSELPLGRQRGPGVQACGNERLSRHRHDICHHHRRYRPFGRLDRRA